MSEELEKGIREEIKAGEVRTYRALFNHYKPMVDHLLIGNGQSEMDRTEFFRETIAHLYSLAKRDLLPADASLKTIIYSIARQLLSQTVSNITDFEEYISISVDGQADGNLISDFKEVESDISSDDLLPYKPTKTGEKTWTVMSWIMIMGSLGLGVVFVVMMTRIPRIEELRERAGLTKQLSTDTVICKAVSVPAAPEEIKTQFIEKSGINPDSLSSRNALSPSFPLQICEDSNDNFDFHYRNSPNADSLILYGIDAETTEVYHLLSIPKAVTETLGFSGRGEYLILDDGQECYLIDRSITKAEPLNRLTK